MRNNPHILQVPKSLVVEYYKEPVEFANKQLEIVWFPDEIKVEKDVQDILINMTLAEKHGVITVLKLFTLYELKAGAEFWNGKFVRIFKRPEMRRMASVFSMFELAIHMPFYRKLNEALHIDNDEFYMDYVNNPVLKARMEFIDQVVSSKNDLYALAAFSMVEGAILYSSFAFLKHFQSQGKNKLLNVVRGINFTVKDENCLIEDTEVLTMHGWKKIQNISLSDKVAQYDINSKEISFIEPINTTSVSATESYIFSGNDFHQHVTASHRMITDMGVISAENTTGIENFVISGIKYGDDVLTDEDKLSIQLIINGELELEWIYAKLPFVSSIWAESAVKYYLELTSP